MPTFVVDSSIAAAWCFPDERTSYANGVMHELSSPTGAVVPRLFAYEIRNSVLMGLRRFDPGRHTIGRSSFPAADRHSLNPFRRKRPLYRHGKIEFADFPPY